MQRGLDIGHAVHFRRQIQRGAETGRRRIAFTGVGPTAQRPVQVTTDLASFWRTTYFEVKKELKGRYPKHYWPDDPLTAEATRRVRPK